MRVFYDMNLPDDEGGGGGGSKAPAANATGGAGPLVATTPSAPIGPARIPLPDYNDPASRLKYASAYYKQYPQVGHNAGDTPLRVNEPTAFDDETPKNMATAAAKKLGLSPALVYSGAMDEGMSGLWKDKNGLISTGANTTDKFPVSGYANFGLDTFSDKFPELVKRGYLPKDFSQNFQKSVEAARQGDNKGSVNSANFNTVGAALQAHAAMLKYHYDDVDSYAKQRGITLSPQARDFFTQAEYNGGEGTGHQMLNDYYNNGYLDKDKFLENRPTTGKGLKDSSYQKVYDTARRRVMMAKGLKEQSLFDN